MVERQRDLLLDNTRRFARGLPANNALLWGARGMGKSSLVKAVHGAVARETKGALALVEIHREDIESLPLLMGLIRKAEDFRLFPNDILFVPDSTGKKVLRRVGDVALSVTSGLVILRGGR